MYCQPPMVSDQELAQGVETLLRRLGPNDVTSVHGVVQQLEAKLGADLSHKAAFIRDHITFLLRPYAAQFHHHPQPQFLHQQCLPQQFIPQQFAPHHHALEPHRFNLQQQLPQQLRFQAPPLPTPENATAAAAPETLKESAPSSGTKRRGGSGGLSKVCGVSPELQAVVGEPALPRTEIVKQLWAYIRKNHLQDPSNKRKIICDDALRMVFETDCTDMFKMNKLLSKHIIPLGPNNESNQAKRVKLDIKSTIDSTEPRPQTQPSSPNVGISEALAKFLGYGGKEMLLSEATRLVCEYVKVNRLEDPLNSTLILCDEKLHELLGCESISAEGLQETLDRHHLFKQQGFLGSADR